MIGGRCTFYLYLIFCFFNRNRKNGFCLDFSQPTKGLNCELGMQRVYYDGILEPNWGRCMSYFLFIFIFFTEVRKIQCLHRCIFSCSVNLESAYHVHQISTAAVLRTAVIMWNFRIFLSWKKNYTVPRPDWWLLETGLSMTPHFVVVCNAVVTLCL